MNGVQKFNEKVYKLVKKEARRQHKAERDVIIDTYDAVGELAYTAKNKR